MPYFFGHNIPGLPPTFSVIITGGAALEIDMVTWPPRPSDEGVSGQQNKGSPMSYVVACYAEPHGPTQFLTLLS